MSGAIIANETSIRLICFLSVFALMALLEALLPRRRRAMSRAVRWPNNLGIVILNTLLLRVAVPTALVGFALAMNATGKGLLAAVALPGWVLVVVSVLLLDLLIYAQHRVFHVVPPLWRLHRVHHADPDFDVTTGVRFHPLEILLSLGFKFAIVAVFGPPAVAVVIFEVLLNAGALFSHANLRLPQPIDHVLRLVLVTPDMHRVHHSVYREETDSNFGFCLSWWDRLFRTYRSAPRAGHADMQIGIGRFGDTRDQRLDELLRQPFRGDGHDASPHRGSSG